MSLFPHSIRVILIYLLNFKQNKHWKLLCFLQIICLFEVTRIVTLHILNTHISVSKNCHNNLSSDNLLYVLYFCYVKKFKVHLLTFLSFYLVESSKNLINGVILDHCSYCSQRSVMDFHAQTENYLIGLFS